MSPISEKSLANSNNSGSILRMFAIYSGFVSSIFLFKKLANSVESKRVFGYCFLNLFIKSIAKFTTFFRVDSTPSINLDRDDICFSVSSCRDFKSST